MLKILLLSIAAIFFLIKNRPQNLYLVLPFSKDNLILSYDGKCAAQINVDYKFDRLLSFNIILRDLDSTQELFNSLLYFNPIGQLLASNTLLENRSISTKGIKKISVEMSDKIFDLRGPFLAELEGDAVKFSYPYLLEYENYYSIIKKLSVRKKDQCNEYYKFEDLIKEFRNA